jgi:hypothetical protein
MGQQTKAWALKCKAGCTGIRLYLGGGGEGGGGGDGGGAGGSGGGGGKGEGGGGLKQAGMRYRCTAENSSDSPASVRVHTRKL